MRILVIFIFWTAPIVCFSQAPFVSYIKPKKYKKSAQINNLKFQDSVKIRTQKNEEYSLYKKQKDDLGKPNFFEHYSANIISIQNGKKMFPVINGEVINYGLGLWSTIREIDLGENRKIFDTVTHFLPFSIITKLSGNYADSSAGVTNDATSYLGAPLTFRISPSFEIPINGLQKNKLFVGLNIDLRLLTIADPGTNKLEASWGTYGSLGMTYMGYGYASTDNGRFEGKWSLSSILYAFKSGGVFNKAIFGNYEKKTLTGIEFFLQFKTSKKEDSKLNFLIGASNGFTNNASNFGRWQFRIGVGS